MYVDTTENKSYTSKVQPTYSTHPMQEKCEHIKVLSFYIIIYPVQLGIKYDAIGVEHVQTFEHCLRVILRQTGLAPHRRHPRAPSNLLALSVGRRRHTVIDFQMSADPITKPTLFLRLILDSDNNAIFCKR